jgi:hypothetical protein
LGKLWVIIFVSENFQGFLLIMLMDFHSFNYCLVIIYSGCPAAHKILWKILIFLFIIILLKFLNKAKVMFFSLLRPRAGRFLAPFNTKQCHFRITMIWIGHFPYIFFQIVWKYSFKLCDNMIALIWFIKNICWSRCQWSIYLVPNKICKINFQLFRPEYHWRDLSSPNAHLVHQNWYRISFTF